MAGKYRSAQGQTVDMAALAAKNEKTRAVGNMKVNARGDTIDSNGKIILPVTEKVAEKYSNTVGNKSAQARKAPAKVAKPVAEQLTEEEKELLSMDDYDSEVEAIKAKEQKK